MSRTIASASVLAKHEFSVNRSREIFIASERNV
jgi:hypothetical protein